MQTYKLTVSAFTPNATVRCAHGGFFALYQKQKSYVTPENTVAAWVSAALHRNYKWIIHSRMVMFTYAQIKQPSQNVELPILLIALIRRLVWHCVRVIMHWVKTVVVIVMRVMMVIIISERKPCKRGGKAKQRGISNDQVYILVARDRQKMTLSGVLGRGRVRTTKLDESIVLTGPTPTYFAQIPGERSVLMAIKRDWCIIVSSSMETTCQRRLPYPER